MKHSGEAALFWERENARKEQMLSALRSADYGLDRDTPGGSGEWDALEGIGGPLETLRKLHAEEGPELKPRPINGIDLTVDIIHADVMHKDFLEDGYLGIYARAKGVARDGETKK